MLLVDSDIERTAALQQRLRDISDATVVQAPAGSTLTAVVAAEAPDLVIVDMGRPDRDALDDLRRVGADNARPIVMFVDRDDRAFMEEAIAAGVSSYNVVGSAFPDVKPIVMAAVAIFRKFQKTTDDLKQAQTALMERETINRAKAAIMRKWRIDEPRAYGWLRKRAMDGNRRIADVAAEILVAVERGELK